MIYQEQITGFLLGLICFPMSALFTPVSDDHPTDPLSKSSRNRTALYRQIPETAPILSYTHSQKYTQCTSLNLLIQLDLHHELQRPTHSHKKANAIKGLFQFIFIYVDKQTADQLNPLRKNQGHEIHLSFRSCYPTHTHTPWSYYRCQQAILIVLYSMCLS